MILFQVHSVVDKQTNTAKYTHSHRYKYNKQQYLRQRFS